MDTNRFATFKVIAAFDENDNFIANVKVDNSDGFYDFIDSVIVIDEDNFVDNHECVE